MPFVRSMACRIYTIQSWRHVQRNSSLSFELRTMRRSSNPEWPISRRRRRIPNQNGQQHLAPKQPIKTGHYIFTLTEPNVYSKSSFPFVRFLFSSFLFFYQSQKIASVSYILCLFFYRCKNRKRSPKWSRSKAIGCFRRKHQRMDIEERLANQPGILQYENEILLQLFHEDGLLILAR